MFGAIIWIGAALSVAGIAILIWCIAVVARARRAGLDDAAMRARLHRVVIWNLAALALSGIGLMMVVAGILLGPAGAPG